jgi:hypothetical protein
MSPRHERDVLYVAFAGPGALGARGIHHFGDGRLVRGLDGDVLGRYQLRRRNSDPDCDSKRRPATGELASTRPGTRRGRGAAGQTCSSAAASAGSTNSRELCVIRRSSSAAARSTSAAFDNSESARRAARQSVLVSELAQVAPCDRARGGGSSKSRATIAAARAIRETSRFVQCCSVGLERSIRRGPGVARRKAT